MLIPDDLDIPLSALLAKCETAVEAAKGARPPPGDLEDDQFQHALDLVRAAEAASDAAGVLPSPGSGETADDVPPGDLRFALLPFWAGELLAARAVGAGVVRGEAARGAPGRHPPPPLRPAVDAPARAAALASAAAEHRRFLSSVRLLGLLPPEARHALAGPAGDEDGEGGEGGRAAADAGGPGPAARRAAKVAAFRARKALAAQAAELRARLAASVGDADPADEHAAVTVEVRLAALAAADALAAAAVETALLRAAARLPPSERARALTDRSAAGPPPDVVAALRAAADGLAGRGGGRVAASADARPCFTPASALGAGAGGVSSAALSAIASSHADRARVAAEVFRPSHILPTKSLAQQADEEVAGAMARSAASARAEAAAKAGAGSDDEDGLEGDGGPRLDAARRMDAWKDDHPRGYGNSKLRPAAL